MTIEKESTLRAQLCEALEEWSEDRATIARLEAALYECKRACVLRQPNSVMCANPIRQTIERIVDVALARTPVEDVKP